MSTRTDEFHHTVESTAAAYGASAGGVRSAHADTRELPLGVAEVTRRDKEEQLKELLAPSATLPEAAGNRAVPEEPDPLLTSFEVDIERIRYSAGFRRLAGKCQVFVTPRNDMVRTRLTHTLEVAGIARRVSESLGLCASLAEAIALGHDCGHGPGGHAAEEAFDQYLPNGFDHALWGADVVLKPLNLCAETLDGVRQHSWKLEAPRTPEGEVVSWADRIAYVLADWSDAVRAGICAPEDLPPAVARAAGESEFDQLAYFASALVRGSQGSAGIGMLEEDAAVLDVFRRSNFEKVYLRPASIKQNSQVVAILQSLVDYYADAPGLLPEVASGEITQPDSGSAEAVFEAVRYVASMTDRFAFHTAQHVLGWDPRLFPPPV